MTIIDVNLFVKYEFRAIRLSWFQCFDEVLIQVNDLCTISRLLFERLWTFVHGLRMRSSNLRPGPFLASDQLWR